MERSQWIARIIDLLGLAALLVVGIALVQRYRPLARFIFDDLWKELDRVAVVVFVFFFLVLGVARGVPMRHTTQQLSVGDDFLYYESAARDILENGPMQRGPEGKATPYFFYPLYPYVLAGAHWLLGEDYGAIIILNYFCIAAVGLLAWLLLRNYLSSGSTTIVLAVLLLFAKRHLVAYAGLSFSDNLYVPAVMAMILASAAAFQRRSIRLLFLAGILTAVAAATRPSGLIYVPFLGVAILLFREFGSFPRRLGAAATYGLGFAAGVSPFTIRNWIVSHKFVLLVASFVMVPIFLLPPEMSPRSFSIDGQTPTFSQALRQVTDLIAEDPGRAVWVEIRKVLYTLGLTTFGHRGAQLPRELIIYPILFLLAAWTGRIPRPVKWVLLAFCGSHLAAVMIAAPWTYGYKTIVPLHLAAILGAAFLLPRTHEQRAFSAQTAPGTRDSSSPSGGSGHRRRSHRKRPSPRR